jgi:Flp pilus assembly pilin Flp
MAVGSAVNSDHAFFAAPKSYFVTNLTSLPLIFDNVGKNSVALPLSIQISQELTFWHQGCAMPGRDTTASRKATKGERVMKLIKNLRNERGQGLMEYTLIVFLVALVFWGGMRSTNIGDELAGSWSKVIDCIATPFSCGS